MSNEKPTGGDSSAPLIALSINTAWNIANFRSGLIRALREDGYRIVALAPPDEHVSRITAMGCRFVPVRMDNQGTNPLIDFRLFLRYLRIFSRERPTALLCFTIKPNIYGALAAQMLGIPVINNVSGLGTAFIRDTWLTRVAQLLYRTALARSHCVFFQNDDDRRLFVERRLVEPGRTALLPGSGINLKEFQPRLAGRNCDDPVRFLLIARLLYDKGVGEYVEAARILRRQRPGTRFAILGFLDAENRTAVARADMERWVADGLVEYLGPTDDVRPHIAASDCVVLPSYREGTPRTLLEAAAMGKPLITTDVPGCRDVVTHGENGLLCRAQDGIDLARCMIEMVDMTQNERIVLGAAGRAKVERHFSEQIVIDAYRKALAAAANLSTRD